MESIGVEVGQKMRSAIKAKLLELSCYVDDELPDYIMVMVANKRSKSQMNEDLQLFLNTKTSTFVEWLHIVLKKLKQVTVTNPDAYKKSSKRKSNESYDNSKVKKEKKPVIITKEEDVPSTKSLTDDLPINANILTGQRKIVILNETRVPSENPVPKFINDNFDIPLLSEVNVSNEQELEDIEKRIRSVRNRLGETVTSDTEAADEDDYLNIKTENDELFMNKVEQSRTPPETPPKRRTITIEPAAETISSPPTVEPKKPEHKRIIFEDSRQSSPVRSSSNKQSIIERLGKRNSNDSRIKSKVISDRRNDDDFYKRRNDGRINKSPKRNKSNNKESLLSRLGVMSKVSVVPPKYREKDDREEELKTKKEVPSMVKIKPRVIPADAQPNKNLLLKAMADAHRSIAQTRIVGHNLKPDALFTKNYRKQSEQQPRAEPVKKPLISDSEKKKLKNLILEQRLQETCNDDSSEKLSEKADKTTDDESDSSRSDSNHRSEVKQKFIITLDGLDKKFEQLHSKPSIKSRLEGRKTPSPIVFNRKESEVVSQPKSNIPDKLPMVQSALALKKKERCKFWPGCRLGDKCEFTHPNSSCEMFPHCKFGDKCVYLHPTCKFGSSCTKKECPYAHGAPKINALPLSSQTLATCKFYPNCVNLACSFYHPKACKYGKYCKNIADCTFLHSFGAAKGNLTWRSK